MAMQTWKLATAGTAVAGVALGSLLAFNTDPEAVETIDLMSSTERAVEQDGAPTERMSSSDPADGQRFTITSFNSPDSPNPVDSPTSPASADNPDSPASPDSPQSPDSPPSPDSPASPDSPDTVAAPAPAPPPAPAPAPDSPDSPASPASADSPDSP